MTLSPLVVTSLLQPCNQVKALENVSDKKIASNKLAKDIKRYQEVYKNIVQYRLLIFQFIYIFYNMHNILSY